MKKYIVIALLMVLGTAYPAYARWSVGAVGGKIVAAAASPYYGYCGKTNTDCSGGDTTPSVDDWDAMGGYYQIANSQTFTVPGTGTVTITELASWSRLNTGSANVSIAVYPSDRSTPVCQVVTEIAMTGAGSWHKAAAANLAPYEQVAGTACTISKGTAYKLAVTQDGGTNGSTAYATGASGVFNYASSDYTGGWPLTIGAGDAGTSIFILRAKVE